MWSRTESNIKWVWRTMLLLLQVEERVRRKGRDILQPKTGSAIPMAVSFREWVELQTESNLPPSVTAAWQPLSICLKPMMMPLWESVIFEAAITCFRWTSHALVIFGKSTEYSIAFEFAKLGDMNFWKLRFLLRCRWWLLQLWSHRLIHMVGALFCSIWERHWDYWQCMFLNPPLWCLVKWFVFCVQELFFPSVCSFWRRDQSHPLLSLTGKNSAQNVSNICWLGVCHNHVIRSFYTQSFHWSGLLCFVELFEL
jgi:hypothetical protein